MSEQSAGALVVFGITGDLARKMTFRSLYRLERRGAAALSANRRREQTYERVAAEAKRLAGESGGWRGPWIPG